MYICTYVCIHRKRNHKSNNTKINPYCLSRGILTNSNHMINTTNDDDNFIGRARRSRHRRAGRASTPTCRTGRGA